MEDPPRRLYRVTKEDPTARNWFKRKLAVCKVDQARLADEKGEDSQFYTIRIRHIRYEYKIRKIILKGHFFWYF